MTSVFFDMQFVYLKKLDLNRTKGTVQIKFGAFYNKNRVLHYVVVQFFWQSGQLLMRLNEI